MGLGEFNGDPVSAVTDLSRSREFYEGKLGLVPSEEDGRDGCQYDCGEGTGLYIWANQNCAYRNNLFVNKRNVGDSATPANANATISIQKPFYNAPHAGAL